MFPDKTVTIIEGEPPFLLCLTLNGTTAVPLVVGLREVDVNATCEDGMPLGKRSSGHELEY